MIMACTIILVAGAFSTGTWTRDLPMTDPQAYITELRRTGQNLIGLGAASCTEIAALVSFLDQAALAYPALSVFATLSSHAPTFEYCSPMLNDARDDVDWVRVKGVNF